MFCGEPLRQGIPEARSLEDCSDSDKDVDLTEHPESIHLRSLCSTTGTDPGILGRSEVGTAKRRAREEEGPTKFVKKTRRFNFNTNLTTTVLDLLKAVIVTPPDKIKNTIDWQDDEELKDWTLNDKEVALALSRWNIQLRKFSTLELAKLFNKLPQSNLLFQDFERRGNVYHSLETSKELALMFLEYQFPTNHKEFVADLVSVLDMTAPKCNTFDVLSPPNCGKTWFFDMVVDFYLNVGHVKNMNRNSNFPFQNCVDRRVLLWNEPNTSPENYDQLKTLFGGDRCAANIKHGQDVVIYRTPLICTGNSRLFPECEAFNSRRHRYAFQYWPELKEHGILKLYPMAWIYVLKHYFGEKYNFE